MQNWKIHSLEWDLVRKCLSYRQDFCSVIPDMKNKHQTDHATLEYIAELIKQKGLRMTAQRRGLIEVLEKSKISLSVKEIFKKLTDADFKIDEASVYRIIDALKELNIVHEHSNGKVKLCSHIACEQSFHLSLECEKCKKVQEPHLNHASEKKIAQTLNLKIDSIRNLHVDYICSQCSPS